VVQISIDPKHLDDDIKQYSHHHDNTHDDPKPDEENNSDSE
jgi:hypothetical protein